MVIKIFKESVYILCRKREDLMQLLLNILFVSANVWLLLGVFQCFLMNVRLILKDINERLLLKENV